MEDEGFFKGILKTYLILFVINVVIAFILFQFSPESIPTSSDGFEFGDYENSTRIFFFPLFQIMFLFIGLILYYMAPLMNTLLFFFRGKYMKFFSWMFGTEVNEENFTYFIKKYTKALILTVSIAVILSYIPLLAFIFELESIMFLFLIYFIVLIIGGIASIVYFCRKLNQTY